MNRKVSQPNEQLEISKLKRHNEELLRMVGELTMELHKLNQSSLITVNTDINV